MGSQVQAVTVEISWLPGTESAEQIVKVDPKGGPMVYTHDGNYMFMKTYGRMCTLPPGAIAPGKPWNYMSSTEKAVQLEIAAKKNVAMIERYGEAYFAGATLPSPAMVKACGQAVGSVA